MNKDKKKNIRLYIGLGILVIFLVVVQHYQQSLREEGKKKFVSNPTSYDTGKDGHKALFLLLSKMGYETSRYRGPESDLRNQDFSHMLMISPYGEHLSKKDAERIYNWVHDGNVLILIDEAKNPLWDLLAVKCRKKLEGDPVTVTISGKTPAAQNVTTVGPVSNWRFELPPPESHPFTILLEDENGVIAASTEIGKGKIFILAAPQMVSNSKIDRNDNVIFLTNLLALAGNSEIAFNETIHGFNVDESFSFSPTAQIIFLQLGVVIGLFYTFFLVRFGKPRISLQDTLRASTEYVRSLGNLFHKARSRDFAALNLLRNFARRTSHTYGVSSELSREKLIDSLRNVDEEFGEKITKQLEDSWQAYRDKKITDVELLRLSTDLERSIRKIQGNELRKI